MGGLFHVKHDGAALYYVPRETWMRLPLVTYAYTKCMFHVEQ